MLTTREKFYRTIKREMEGYIPFEFSLCPSQLKKFWQMTGRKDYEEYYDIPIRFIGVKPLTRDVDFSRYFDGIGADITIDHWGVAHKKGGMEHFSRMIPPMSEFESLEEFEDFPYPSADKDYDWGSFPEKVLELQSRDLIVAAGMAMTVFEIAWYLRGMDNFMVDLMTQSEIACYHMDRITDIRCECAIRYAKAGVDILHLGDDVATQRDMMISPSMWRIYIKPRLKQVIDAAKGTKPDILIDYHSDGNIEAIIPDLIEIGVDILNPIQPECMDPAHIKNLYGDRLSFRGAIGTQTTMPFGKVEEVKRICRDMIEKMGEGGGYILAPTHVLEPEVPWENIEAMIDVVKNYSL